MQRTQFTLFIACAMFAIASSQTYSFTYKNVNDLSLTLDVYVPSGNSGNYPVFFTIHGGGYVESSKDYGLTNLERNYVLSLGFVYVTIDYRLNPGVLLPDIVQDVQDAYNWVRNSLGNHVSINPDNIVFCGRSAGGGLALMSGYFLSPRPKAIVVFYPGSTNFTDPYFYNPSTPVSTVLSTAANLLRSPIIDEYFASGSVDPRNALFNLALSQGKSGWLLVSSDPNEPTDQVMTALQNYSAVYHVDSNYPPTYLVHGQSDYTVPYSQSVEMANVLDSNGVKHVLSIVPGVGHSFDNDVSDLSDDLWKQYISPALEFAQHMISSQASQEQIQN